MKDIINVINEESQQVNEGIFSAFDLSLAVIISSSLTYLLSMGFRITGNTIQSILFSKNKDKHGKSKVKFLQELKDFSRGLDIDLSPNSPAMSVLNNPGEWSTEMCYELKHALQDQLTPEQKKEFDRLERQYIDERNKFVRF